MAERKERVIYKKGKWYAQSQFRLLWLIPLPFWRDYWRIVGDLVLGEYTELATFETKQECERWLNAT